MNAVDIATLISLGLATDEARALAASQTEMDVAAIIRKVARRMTQADGVSVVFKRGDRVAYVDEDAIGPLWKGRDFPIEACISGWAILNKQTVAIANVYDDERIPAPAYKPTFVNSLMMAPVSPADPFAAIGAYWDEPHRATPSELAALEAVAEAAAMALTYVRHRREPSDAVA
jgi:GAF domain-containing protein